MTVRRVSGRLPWPSWMRRTTMPSPCPPRPWRRLRVRPARRWSVCAARPTRCATAPTGTARPSWPGSTRRGRSHSNAPSAWRPRVPRPHARPQPGWSSDASSRRGWPRCRPRPRRSSARRACARSASSSTRSAPSAMPSASGQTGRRRAEGGCIPASMPTRRSRNTVSSGRASWSSTRPLTWSARRHVSPTPTPSSRWRCAATARWSR
mmetsp:Transcript_8400/g.35140  ORF Transcript_8400/g.35140 Transcript_8400/m.35140 type:complete len:208 (-) Transcript_8400:338-961(-)